MSEDFLKDPLSLFSVKGKTAVVTGATGAFGALAAKVMAGAGANVVICGRRQDVLRQTAEELAKETKGEIEAIGCESKIGNQVVPALLVFHTPPAQCPK